MVIKTPPPPNIPYPEKLYQPLNLCAYCASEDQLSTEHVIPLALGSKIILPKASCEECRKATSKVEDFVLRKYLGPLRSYLGLPSRKPALRPDAYKLTLTDGQRRWQKKVKLEDHPGVVQFMILDPPGRVAGRPRIQETFNFRPIKAEIFLNMGERLRRLGATGAIDHTEIRAMDLARMIAKIGMAFAVAELGRKPFEEFYVTHLIREPAPDWNYWVGGFEYGEDAHFETLHKLSLLRRGNDLSAIVHLFGRYCPRSAYEVIVGRLQAGCQESAMSI